MWRRQASTLKSAIRKYLQQLSRTWSETRTSTNRCSSLMWYVRCKCFHQAQLYAFLLLWPRQNRASPTPSLNIHFCICFYSISRKKKYTRLLCVSKFAITEHSVDRLSSVLTWWEVWRHSVKKCLKKIITPILYQVVVRESDDQFKGSHSFALLIL